MLQLGVAVVLALCALLYALSPWLLGHLAPRLAPLLGLDALHVDAGHPGLHGVSVDHVEANSGRFRLEMSGIRVGYAIGGLIAGRVDEVVVERLEVRVDAPGAPVTDGKPGTPLPAAADPAALFAGLPWRSARVERLELALPALEFSASGTLSSDVDELAVDLQAHAPAQAQGFELAARLTRDGRLALRFAETGAAAPPFLSVNSVLEGKRLALTGEARLGGFVLDLGAGFAGVPAGEGALTGSFQASVPWPLPSQPDWSTPRADGALSLAWRPDRGDWRIDTGDVRWRLDGGVLAADVEGTIGYAGRALRLQAGLTRLTLPDLTGDGTLSLLPVAGSQPPYADVDWRLGPAQLEVDGSIALRDALLELARERFGLPSGTGALDVGYRIRLPWPLPALEEIEARADGTLGGRWQDPELDVTVAALDGTWKLDGRRLSGGLGARVGHGGLAADVGLNLARLEQIDGAVAADGELRIGKLAPLPFSATQALDGGAGSLTLRGPLRVSSGLAADALLAWTQPFDLSAGELDVAADLSWTSPEVPGGRVKVGLRDVAAGYEEYRLSGLDADLEFSARDGVWTLAPAPIRVATVATGVALEAVESGIAWAGGTVQVQTTTARVLGGSMRLAPFDYAIDRGAARFTVELIDLSLEQVLALEGEQVAGSGTLTGSLPVVLQDNAPSVAGGQVRAEPPGGTLRVSAALAGGTGQPGLDFALRALQDFRYQVLDADVSYSPDGDLTLAVHLQGRNPAIEGGRPIHYNLTVNENLPVLLRSLRLERDVTEGIERRLNR